MLFAGEEYLQRRNADASLFVTIDTPIQPFTLKNIFGAVIRSLNFLQG